MASGDSGDSSDETKDVAKDSAEIPSDSSTLGEGNSVHGIPDSTNGGSQTTSVETEISHGKDPQEGDSEKTSTISNNTDVSSTTDVQEAQEPMTEDAQQPTADQSAKKSEGYGPDISYIRSVWEKRVKNLGLTIPEEKSDEEKEEFEAPLRMYSVLDPVISRKDWGAMQPRRLPPQRDGDVSMMMVLPTKTEACYTGKECTKVIRNFQRDQIVEKNEDDVPYNFLVGGDGRIYEGLGWKARAPYPHWMPEEYNDGKVFSIGFVGPYGGTKNEVKPTEHMIHARRLLTRYGVEQNYIGRGLDVMTIILGKI